MTDNVIHKIDFLQKLEDKVMVLLAELETLRKELGQLRQDNATLKAEKLTYTKKLQGLIVLLDSLAETPPMVSDHPVLSIQEEYANA